MGCSGRAPVRALRARHHHRAHCGVGSVPEIDRREAWRGSGIAKLAWVVVFATLSAAPAAAQQGAIPDLRGTWKGESESIILGAGNPHHAAPPASEPRLNSVAFTMTVDKQDGRGFSGTFSSARGSEKFVAVISRNNTILLVDDDGYTIGTILAPNRMELCYMHLSQVTRLASCAELTKQP